MPWFFYKNTGALIDDIPPDPLPVCLITSFVSASSPNPNVPAGWLLCDGSPQVTANYPELAALLAFPAAPGVNFNVPNMNTRFPIGTSGAYPLRTTGGSSPHVHPVSAHTHTNDHRHGVTATHSHSAEHYHDSTHHHSAGTYTLNIETGAERHARDTGGGSTDTAKGPGSGASHNHDISGNTGGPTINTVLSTKAHNASSGGAATSGSQPTSLGGVAPAVVPAGDILPPYLNVYFIIKAVDTGG